MLENRPLLLMFWHLDFERELFLLFFDQAIFLVFKRVDFLEFSLALELLGLVFTESSAFELCPHLAERLD